jgi:hypothetical protein
VRSSIFLLFLALLAIPAYAQVPTPRPSARPEAGNSPLDDNEAQERVAHDMAKKQNEQREAAIKNDTAKLLKLATELQAYVDKSNENVLSLDVIKKAEEIEKLAHSVKDKMKGPN